MAQEDQGPRLEPGEAIFYRELDRRQFLRLVALTGSAAAAAAFIAACGGTAATPTAAAAVTPVATGTPAATATAAATAAATATATASVSAAAGRAIKIGYVSPATGPLALFAEADQFIFDGVRKAIGAGVPVGGSIHPIEIIAKDSQSDPNRAATVALELITGDGIDLMLVASTPETTNPVSDQCEANGVPCLSTVAPWQPWFFARQKDPANPKPFDWTYHFFWGLEDIIAVFLDMWGQVTTNKKIGAIWPNDGDGNAWGDPKLGFPPAFASAGYGLTDPGRYQDLTDDFSAQISQFKTAGVEIVTGVPIPPDFTTFWTQAAQQGFKPKVASVGKALLFPQAVAALGDLGEGLSTEVWWSPMHPFTSSLTKDTAAAVAADYTATTNKQWTQPIGFGHALFEIAVDALKRTSNVDDKAALRDAIAATKLDTIVGPIEFTGQPFKNIAKTPLVGGQWRKGTNDPYDLVIVSNKEHPEIPAAGTLQPIGS